MSDSRTWLHARLAARAPLTALLSEGAASLVQHRSFNAAPRKRPYIVLRSSLANSEIRDDGVSLISATHHRLFVHDEPGSYLKIDAIVDEIRGAIESATADGNLVKGEWLETSEDLEDPDMGTILRWCRVRLVHRT